MLKMEEHLLLRLSSQLVDLLEYKKTAEGIYLYFFYKAIACFYTQFMFFFSTNSCSAKNDQGTGIKDKRIICNDCSHFITSK